MSKNAPNDLRNKLTKQSQNQSRNSKNRRVVLLTPALDTARDDRPPRELNLSFQINDNGKRAHDDRSKNRTNVRKRLCGNNRMSATTSQNLFPPVTKSPNIPKSVSGANIRNETKPYNNQTNMNPIPVKSSPIINRHQLSTIYQSGQQFVKSFETRETSMRQNLVLTSQNHTTTSAKPMCYTYLKELCGDQITAEEVSSKLYEHKQLERFEALLQESEIRYDLMKLIIHAIYKVCQSRILTHSNKILGILSNVHFWSTLGKFIVELETRKECLADPDVSSLLKHICKILSISLERIPHLFSLIPLHQLQSAVSCLKEGRNVPIHCIVDNLLEDVTSKCELVKKSIREKGESQVEPPDDFRKLSVFPTVEDIFNKRRPFLRENIVKKPFSSVNQYLDIHFRLLKEDSLAGLRHGIQDLQKNYKHQQYGQAAVETLSKSSNDVRPQNDVIVYNSVTINEQVPVTKRQIGTKGIVYNVAFNSKHASIKRVNWKRSKRLLFGSLVCLISNDFNKVHFATVQDRNPDMLAEGYIQLCFEGNEVPGYDNMQEVYRMVESNSAYFVAYRHILQRLQDIDEETMPFKKYIVFCEHEIDKPTYLKIKSGEENPVMVNLESAKPKQSHLQLLQKTDGDITFRLKNVNPYDLRTWPGGDVIGLNESQYKAFQSALQREFVVIQGPPGTGKTYLGLKIAHTLLDNNHLWKDPDDEKPCPILMLAYTNHALDSFLEGLSINRRDIIRIGGRSSSDALKECNLNVMRRNRRNTDYQNGTKRLGGRRFRQVEREKETCHAKLNRYTEIFTKSYKGILPAKEFREFMPKEYTEYLSENHHMLAFLGISLNPTAKKNAAKLEKEELFDEYYGRDLEGHFYVGHMAEDDESHESKNEVLICSAEETARPAGILELLKTEGLDRQETIALEERTVGADLARLSIEQRWSLYLLWLAKLREFLDEKVREKQRKYLELSNEYEELRNIEDLGILRNARVVGMTTTCASKNHKLLQQLRPRVVIIEEAAELFEAHIVMCLTKHCQHLILIGDHQQLRPNPSVYKLSVKYNLDVSLLERMVEAGVPHNRLSVQHRMRPEISQMFRHIYQDGLEDHVSVTQYKDIRGVSKSLFFIDHDLHESVHDNVHSKVNQHEAEFLVELCLYLLRQTYQPSQITILTTYTGQMFVIRDLIKNRKEEFQDNFPRVSSVDNFQGEENDIILLSLVRNNKDDKIGFLKSNNRVCVALSRARIGLYIMGNRKMLSKESPLWKAVLVDFDKRGCIGKSLPLVCSNHQSENLVSTAEDFRALVPNGGCLEKCQHRLECGHSCPQMCHPSGHENFKCQKPCARNVKNCDVSGHNCTKLCHETCDSTCQYRVDKVLNCGHKMTLACSYDINIAKCKEQCENTLDCRHRCQAFCSAPCTKKCMELVKKTDLSCGHENTMACSATQKDCTVPCNTLLDCEHSCTGSCGECIQGRVHKKCVKKCDRTLICSHQCKSSCTKDCPPCREKCPRKCFHSECQKSCGEICIPCMEPCEWECEHHKCSKLCSDMCDRPRCNEPCKRTIPCGEGRRHPCVGLCGERCVCSICNTNNGEDVRELLFGTEGEDDARFIMLKDCEHIFEYTGLDRMMDTIDEEIKTKVCPLCTVPILRSFRYGNVVKRIHNDIENIKRKVLHHHNTDVLKEKKVLVLKLAHELSVKINLMSMNMKPCDIEEAWKTIANYFNRICKSSSVYFKDVLLLESAMHLVQNWHLISTSYEEAIKSQYQSHSSRHIEFESEMQHVLRRILVPPTHTSALILNQLNLELQRLSLKRDVLILMLNCATLKFSLGEDDEEIVTKIKKVLQNKKIIDEEFLDKFKEGITEIYSRNPQLSPITKEEKIQIVHAIGLKQGHWFKCRNGHYYAIGECGGAMEESKCPECGEVIGGQHHRLADDNELAPEMDGATHAAWSDQANMQNYQFED